MLSRAEIGTREHVLLWLDSKDPTAAYCWEKSCPAESYAAEHGTRSSPMDITDQPVGKRLPADVGRAGATCA